MAKISHNKLAANSFYSEKKKYFSCLLIVMVFSFVSDKLLFADDNHLNIAMILWRGETQAEQGFKDGWFRTQANTVEAIETGLVEIRQRI